jgi:DNA-3-methyladenine glycosylase I
MPQIMPFRPRRLKFRLREARSGTHAGVRSDVMNTKRCAWVANAPDLDVAYHDEEWGVPVFEDHRLFEYLTLEGAQAGLSWSTILAKREGYRRAFSGFDVEKIARYNRRSVDRLLRDPRIVRHRLKIESTISNARAYLELRERDGSFARYIWSFVDGEPIDERRQRLAEIPASTRLSEAMSRDLRSRGFRFVGATTCYAFMQAAGLVNDHTVDCFRHAEVSRMRGRSGR